MKTGVWVKKSWFLWRQEVVLPSSCTWLCLHTSHNIVRVHILFLGGLALNCFHGSVDSGWNHDFAAYRTYPYVLWLLNTVPWNSLYKSPGELDRSDPFYVSTWFFSRSLQSMVLPTLGITFISVLLFLFYSLIKETIISLSFDMEISFTSPLDIIMIYKGCVGNHFSGTVNSVCWKSSSASGRSHLSNFMLHPLGSWLSASVLYNSLMPAWMRSLGSAWLHKVKLFSSPGSAHILLMGKIMI